MSATIQSKSTKKSLVEKYQRDYSKDSFLVKKGEKALDLLHKSGYLTKDTPS
jgi:hypothetical protein